MSTERNPSRRERRVLLALLSGASNLSGYPLARAAQARGRTVYLILGRLERDGIAVAEERDQGDGKPQRRFYHLTLKGRTHALSALGLQDGSRVAREGEQ